MSTKKSDKAGEGNKNGGMPGKPFRSKLTPFYDLIKKMRFEYATWQQIADEITRQGVKTHGHAVCEFFKRHSTRPAPLGFPDRQPEQPSSANSTPTTRTEGEGTTGKVSQEAQSAVERLKAKKSQPGLTEKPKFSFDPAKPLTIEGENEKKKG